jgi:hypothetical protein
MLPGSGVTAVPGAWSIVVAPTARMNCEVCTAVKSTIPVPSEAISDGVRSYVQGVAGPVMFS